MPRTPFLKKMKFLAGEIDKPDDSNEHRLLINLKLPENIGKHIARIARATRVRPGQVLLDYLKTQIRSLESVATAVEKVTSKERLQMPLYRQRKSPSLKDLKEFVQTKKGKK